METPVSGSPGRQDVLLAALQVQVWNTSVVWLKTGQEQPLPWKWLYHPQQKRLHWNENLGYSSLSSSIPLSLGLSETPLECQELPLGTQSLTFTKIITFKLITTSRTVCTCSFQLLQGSCLSLSPCKAGFQWYWDLKRGSSSGALNSGKRELILFFSCHKLPGNHNSGKALLTAPH